MASAASVSSSALRFGDLLLPIAFDLDIDAIQMATGNRPTMPGTRRRSHGILGDGPEIGGSGDARARPVAVPARASALAA